MGRVVISIDAELGWGFHDLDSPPADRIRAGPDGWRRLLELLDRYDIPATWAVVGHLFLDECDGRHRDHPAPRSWFPERRGVIEPEYLCAPDLITAIREADSDHEIASHSFSHVVFGDPGTSRDLAAAEVAKSVELAGEREIAQTTFIFPRNRIGHREVLSAYGFTCYRGAVPRGDGTPAVLKQAQTLARATGVDTTPPLVKPRIDRFGLVDIPASLFLFGFEGLARSVVEPFFGDPIERQAKNGIDRVREVDRILHLWLHPNNMIHDRDVERVRRILEHIDARRDGTTLQVETMQQVADRVLANEAANRVSICN